jgi:hypothetical protein
MYIMYIYTKMQKKRVFKNIPCGVSKTLLNQRFQRFFWEIYTICRKYLYIIHAVCKKRVSSIICKKTGQKAGQKNAYNRRNSILVL